MEPVISPWLIYLMGVVDVLKVIVLGVSLVWLFGYFITGAIVGSDGDYDTATEAEKKQGWNLVKKSILATPIILLGILIPTESRIVKMIVAQSITPNNIQKVVGVGKDLKENLKKDVLDIIMAIKETE